MQKKILFVDDELNFLDGIKRMFHTRRQQWDVHLASSVDEALSKLSKTEYDIIISDIKMPGKSGFDFLKSLSYQQITRNIPIVILTGINDQSLKCKALNMGAMDLLSKPIKKKDLFARIQSLLNMKSFQDELKSDINSFSHKINELKIELDRSRLETIWKLAKAAESRDKETGNHNLRVGHYCRIIAKKLGKDNDFCEMIFLASQLHDIGKIGTPDDILLKAGKLTLEEREIMEQHCFIGADILLQEPKVLKTYNKYTEHYSKVDLSKTDNPFLRMAATIAFTHHEKWDGKGYPQSLVSDNIPLESRIVAISDVYDALSFSRPYKEACDEKTVLRIMNQEAGHHFDHAVFLAFEHAINGIQTIKEQFPYI